jgi:hypothetical protein
LAFARGLQPIAIEGDESGTGLSFRVAETSPKQLAGMDAALFLMTFIASEALVTILAFRH